MSGPDDTPRVDYPSSIRLPRNAAKNRRNGPRGRSALRYLKSPARPPTLRRAGPGCEWIPSLLAGVAIIDRAGLPMLKMLQGHMMGDNKNRFAMATDHLISPVLEWGPPQQLQLI